MNRVVGLPYRLVIGVRVLAALMLLLLITAPLKAQQSPASSLTIDSPAACVAPIVDGTTAFTGVVGKIAFTSNRDGNREIYVMDATGSNQTNLTNNAEDDYEPAWSPDGSRIAFVSSRGPGSGNIYVMNADGTGVVALTNSADEHRYPAWSPSGQQIAYSRACGSLCSEILVMDADGTDQTVIVSDSANQFPLYSAPNWRPTLTEWIAFQSVNSNTNIEIHRVFPNGSSHQVVTANGINTRWPNWNPNGVQIAYDKGPPGGADIWVMDPNGSSQTNLTNASGQINQEAAFSPDGTRIAFTTFRNGTSEIYVMDADGSDQTRLTFNSSSDNDPDWQPLNIPTVRTAAATAITHSSATLNGTANPNGVASQAWFAWCLDPNNLSQVTSQVSIGTGLTSQTITADLTGLSPNTTYYFQIVAEGPTGGPQRGSVLQFQTSAATEPTPVPSPASGITSSLAQLNGTVNPNGTDTTYWFEWGDVNPPTQPTFVQSVGSGNDPVVVSTNLQGLAANWTYYFRVAAQRAGGDVQRSDILSFQTLPPDPSPVTGNATAVSFSSATLNGTVNPNGGATTYWFEWGTTNPPPTSQPTTETAAGSGTTNVSASAGLSNLTASTTYYFLVAARGPSNQVQRGNVQSFVTAATPEPSPVTDPADTVTTASAMLRGRVNPNGVATSSWFQYGTTNPPTTNTASQPVGSGTTVTNVSASVTGLLPNQLYYYRTVARGPSGSDQYGLTLSFTTNPLDPVAVTGGVTNRTATSATLGGSVNPNGSAAEYWFEYGISPPQSAGSTTSFGSLPSGSSSVAVTRDVSGLTPNTTYYYRAFARRIGSSTPVFGDAALFVTLQSEPTPTTGAANGVGPSSATLTGTVNPNSVPTEYWFEWGTSNPPPTTPPPASSTTAMTPAGSGSAAVTASAVLNGLAATTTYYFRLVARGPSTLVQRGAVQSFLTTVTPEPSAVTLAADTITATAATVRGRVNPNGVATSSRFQWGTAANQLTNETSSTSLGSGNIDQDVSAILPGLTPAQTYYFRAVARGPSNQDQVGSTLSFTTEPLAPVLLLQAESSVTSISATLNGSINPNGSPVEFWFEYGTVNPPTVETSHGEIQPGAAPVVVSRDLTGLSPSTTYFYRLAARVQGTVTILRSGVQSFLTPARQPIPSACAANPIAATTARLNGTVNPNGEVTSYFFLWGTTNPPLIAAPDPPIPVGNGNTAVTVFTNLTTLTPSATYFCRVVARWSGGDVPGPVASFTTLGRLEPIVIADPPNPVSGTAATLRGRVNPRGSDTTVWFMWGVDPNNLNELTNPQFVGSGSVEVPFSASLTDLRPGTTYYVRAVARGPSNVEQIDPAPPAPPLSFTTTALAPEARTEGCTSVTINSLTVHGAVNPNGIATTYWFRVGTTDPPTGFETPHLTAGDGTSFVLVNAPVADRLPNQKYFYRLVVQRTGGPEVTGAVRDCQTLARPPDATTLPATEITSQSARLNGRIHPQNAQTQYWFEWGTSADALTSVPIIDAPSGNASIDVSYVLTGLRPETRYFFRIGTRNVAGTVYGAVLDFVTPAVEIRPGRGRVFVTLFWDANDNGIRDAGEPTVVSADSSCKGASDIVDTDSYLGVRWRGGAESGSARPNECAPGGGIAIASDLLPGVYKFSIVLPQTQGFFTAWRQTEHDPSRREKDIEVTAGQTHPVLFGVRKDEAQLIRSTVNTTTPGIPIVVIHGLCGSAQSWNAFETFFQSVSTLRSRFTLWRFVYSTGARGTVPDLPCDRAGVPDHSAARVQGLASELRRLVERNADIGTSRVILIGHSLGGLIGRSYMQEWGGRNRVEHLITLATPHHGFGPDALAALALGGEYKPGELSALEWDAYPRNEGGNPWLRCLNGAGDQDCMNPGSGSRSEARVASLAKTIAVGTFTNDRQTDSFVPLTSSLISGPILPLVAERHTGICSHRAILDNACLVSKSTASWVSEFQLAPTPAPGATGVFTTIATLLRTIGRRPTSVSARQRAGTSTADILWEPPTGEGSTGIVYQVEGQPRGASESAWIGVSPRVPDTSFALTSVPHGAFAIRVRAFHLDGENAESEAVPLDVGVCLGSPGVPRAVTPTVVGSVVALTWQAPTDGCPPTAYQVAVGSRPGLSDIATILWTGTTIAGNVTTGVFHVCVRAANGEQLGDRACVIIPVGVAPPPAAPNNVTTTTSPGAVTFNWTASPGATGYLLEAGTAPGLSDLVTVPLSAATTHAFTGVPRGRYFVRVRAVNASGPGAASVELEVIVP